MRKIFILLFLASVIKGFSQNQSLDSFEKKLYNYKKDDSGRINLLYDYSRLLFKTGLSSGDYARPIYFAREGLRWANKINRQDKVVFGQLMLGDFYKAEFKEDSAVSVYLEGLNIAEKLELKKFIPWFYSSLGESYRMLDNLKMTEYYDRKYYDIVTKQKNDTLTLFALNLLISLKDQQGKTDTVKILIEKALSLAFALKDVHALNRLLMQKGDQFRQQNKYIEAINLYHDASKWKVANNFRNDTYLLCLISETFQKLNQKDSANWYARKAVEQAKKYHLRKEMGDAYETLFDYYYHFGEFKQALETKIILDSVNKEISNPGSSKTVVLAEMKYAQEKKDLMASVELANTEAAARRKKNLTYGIITTFLLLVVFLFYNNRQKQKAKIKIEKAYNQLKNTQSQLIQSEKMASLGELTAGIAHEIQNPLNFVNNFSEVNQELLEEVSQAVHSGNMAATSSLIRALTENEMKINHHGKRADAIVKAMLMHSQSGSGKKEPTDINALTNEFLRLAYHGIRAREKTFNAYLETRFDPSMVRGSVVPQDMGRVLLNIYNNAFYAVMEKKKIADETYEPTVSVTTKRMNHQVLITVRDNGSGIPRTVINKIFQPFFTTKPTGQGTGLGLSLSYDIVKTHGGEIRVNTQPGEFTEFIIQLPA